VRRRSLPCPDWLVPLLENPYMNQVAGSELLLDRAGVEEGMAVLDVGCGPGRVAIPAAGRVGSSGRVVALDVQEGMLRRLEERIAELGIGNVEPVHAGAGEGAITENTFDRALLVTVLGEIPRREEALREIYESLKPGAILSITEVIPGPHYQRQATVRVLTETTGFLVEDIFGGFPAYTMIVRRRDGA